VTKEVITRRGKNSVGKAKKAAELSESESTETSSNSDSSSSCVTTSDDDDDDDDEEDDDEEDEDNDEYRESRRRKIGKMEKLKPLGISIDSMQHNLLFLNVNKPLPKHCFRSGVGQMPWISLVSCFDHRPKYAQNRLLTQWSSYPITSSRCFRHG